MKITRPQKMPPSDHRSPLLANLPSHDPLKLMLSYPSPVECTAVILQPIRQCSRVIRVSRYLWDLPEISNYGWFPQRPIQSPTIHHLHHLDPSPHIQFLPHQTSHGLSQQRGQERQPLSTFGKVPDSLAEVQDGCWRSVDFGCWEDLSKLHQSRQRRMTFGAN